MVISGDLSTAWERWSGVWIRYILYRPGFWGYLTGQDSEREGGCGKRGCDGRYFVGKTKSFYGKYGNDI